MLRALLVFVAVLVAGCFGSKKAAPIPAGYQPLDGDLLFQSLPHNPLIDAIEGCTGSPFSHCGIVVKRGEEWKVLEAIGPVKETKLPLWIAQGRGNAYVAYRLRAPLAGRVPEIIAAAERYKGRPYDIHYELDDGKIYCSELLWKSIRDATGQKLGSLRKLGELNWQPHEDVIRRIEAGGLPLDREMITPRDFSEAPQLQEVFRYRM